jgi:phenylalanyl-tRNA synthetase beta chain
MKVPLSWIREFIDITASAEEIGARMGLRGLPLEGLEPFDSPSGSAASPNGSLRPGPETDVVMDFEVTANRPDCLSVRGIAREIAAAYGLPFRDNVVWRDELSKIVDRTGGVTMPITIDEPDLCGRYVGIAADVTSIGPSPDWMQQRLQACGVRPISNVVDITNYVLLEIGQPMHAFDYAKLAGPAIVVRRARPGERLTTLDGKARALTTDMLVIADAERAQAIGGVMGGADSEVSSATRRIVFESAYFNPRSVRATSKTLGLKSEASTRFERGVDPTVQLFAALRACELLAQIGAGTAAGTPIDVSPDTPSPKELSLSKASVAGLLGMPVPDRDVMRILQFLGFDVEPSGDDWSVTAPSWRVDIHRKEDIIEEIGRHYGYEHLPSTFPGVEQAPPPSDPRIARDRRMRTALLGMGFSEAITFAFIEAAAAQPYLEGQPPVALANPLSEKFGVMRPSLLPGLVDVLSHNRRHGRPDVRIFEIGTRFTPAGETRGAAFAWMGLGTPDHWSGARRAVDFSDIKGVVEQLALLASVPVTFTEAERAYLVRGRAANILINGQTIGLLGQLSPEIAEARDLPAASEVYVAELNLDAVTAASPIDTRRATTLPRYPFVVRDVSMLVANTLSADTVRGTIRSAAPDTLVQVREFDRYEGKGIPDGKVSLSFRLTFQSPERTLTDDEVQAAMQRIIDALTRDLQAVQR